MTCSLTVLLSCLVLAAPGQGEGTGDHVVDIIKQIRQEMRLEGMLLKKELEDKVQEITKQLNVHDRKIAEVELKSTLPSMMTCAQQDKWTTPSSTITYDHLSTNYKKEDRMLDVTTGIFTALVPGHYTVTYSGHARLDPGEAVDFFLYHNGRSLGYEGQWVSFSASSSTYDQGTKSLVSFEPSCSTAV